MPWHPNDEDCVLCDVPYSAMGGIETTMGWVCYECAAWTKRLAAELPPNLRGGGDWRGEIDMTP